MQPFHGRCMAFPATPGAQKSNHIGFDCRCPIRAAVDGSGDLFVTLPRHPEDLGKWKETQKETQFLKTLRMKQSQEGDAGRKQILRPSAGVHRAQNAGEEDAVPKLQWLVSLRSHR